jgi:hypothetical protein
MKPDEFEQQLQGQPLRRVPAGWREEILRAAHAARPAHASRIAHHEPATPWWREWLWPCPQAWAALAGVWIIILSLNMASPARPPTIASYSAPSPQVPTTLGAQRRELARLLEGAPESMPVPKASPSGPRSEASSPFKA